MKIEILEENIKLMVSGNLMSLEKGDRITVNPTQGADYCAFGWAKDLDGDEPTGERKPGANGEIKPANVKQTV